MMMQVMRTPDGKMPMMGMVAMVVGSKSVLVGWLYHLFNSAVIGAIFGWLLGSRARAYGSGLGLGAVYGIAWWILGGLILMPVLLGMPAFAPITDPTMRPGGMGSLMSHIIYGLILGAGYVWLYPRVEGTTDADALRSMPGRSRTV